MMNPNESKHVVRHVAIYYTELCLTEVLVLLFNSLCCKMKQRNLQKRFKSRH